MVCFPGVSNRGNVKKIMLKFSKSQSQTNRLICSINMPNDKLLIKDIIWLLRKIRGFQKQKNY